MGVRSWLRAHLQHPVRDKLKRKKDGADKKQMQAQEAVRQIDIIHSSPTEWYRDVTDSFNNAMYTGSSCRRTASMEALRPRSTDSIADSFTSLRAVRSINMADDTDTEDAEPTAPPPRLILRPIVQPRHIPSLRREQRTILRRSQKPMTADHIHEILTCIGIKFDTMPHAITGLSAMVCYGYRGRIPNEVTILCPFESVNTISAWAVARGFDRLPMEPCSFAVTTSDGEVRAIRFKSGVVDFTQLRTYGCINTPTDGYLGPRILNLSGIAEEIALDYVNNLPRAPAWKQYRYAEDMRWVLRTMAQRGERLVYINSSWVTSRLFWIPFALSFPDTVELFAKVGLVTGSTDVVYSFPSHMYYTDVDVTIDRSDPPDFDISSTTVQTDSPSDSENTDSSVSNYAPSVLYLRARESAAIGEGNLSLEFFNGPE